MKPAILMADLKVSIQSQPVKDPEHETLQYLISRINEQKGSFRSVTEQSLEEEIKHAVEDTAISEGEEIEDGEEQVEDDTVKRDKIWKAREEMMRQVEYATLHTGRLFADDL